MISRSANCCLLLIALSILSAHSGVSPGLAQVTGKNNCYKYDRQEATKLKSTARRVTRQQTKLTIKTQQRSVVFQDICDRYQEQSTTYTLKSYYSDINYFLVYKSAYEEYEYTLINGKTGEQTTLWAEPVFAPNRQRFTTMAIDELNGNTSAYIYRIDPTGVKVEYQDLRKKWWPLNPKWLNNSTIEFTHQPNTKPTIVKLHRLGRTWRDS
jgi:hypothetical protein